MSNEMAVVKATLAELQNTVSFFMAQMIAQNEMGRVRNNNILENSYTLVNRNILKNNTTIKSRNINDKDKSRILGSGNNYNT